MWKDSSNEKAEEDEAYPARPFLASLGSSFDFATILVYGDEDDSVSFITASIK
jgi:hypothetical protein